MKKIKLLLLIAGTLSIWQLKAQTGMSCSNSRTTTTNYLQILSDTSQVVWYSFIADSNHIVVEAANFGGNKPRKIEFYTGSCISPILITQDSLIGGVGIEVEIERNDLIIGNQYFVKLSFTAGNNNNGYLMIISKFVPDPELCLKNLSTGIVCKLDDDGPEIFDCTGLYACVGDTIQIYYTYITSAMPINITTGYTLLGAVSGIIPGSGSFYYVCTAPGNFLVQNPLNGDVTVYNPMITFSHQRLYVTAPTTPIIAPTMGGVFCEYECIEFQILNPAGTYTNVVFFSGMTPCLTGYFYSFAAGSYVLPIEFNNGLSCATTLSYSFTVVPKNFTITNTSLPCSLNQNFNIVTNCTGSSNYTWDILNSSGIYESNYNTTTPFSSYTFSAPGTYTVYVTDNSVVPSITKPIIVFIGGIVNLPSFVQGDGSCLNICFNNTTKCYLKNITQWLWTATGPGGFTQSEITTDACFSFPATGIYTICLQQDNNPPGGTNPALIGVSCQTISVVGPTPIVITNTLLSLCNLPVGGLVTLNPNLTLGATSSATWVASSGGTALPIPFTTGINGIITYNLTGFSTYTAPIVFCVTTTNNDCPSTQCVTIYPCCPTVTGTVVYNNTTFTTNTTLSGPTNYHFSGVITLSSGANLFISGADVTFDPNTKIVVNTNSKLTSSLSYFHACSAMWDGVYLNNGSKLVIDQCTIEDAKRAFIDTLGATSIFIENSWFNKNYESIILKATNTTQKLTVWKNVFSCNIIPAIYKTVPVALNWYFTETETSVGALPPTGTLPPYNAKSYSGVTLFQTKTPSNPSQYVQIDKYNLFDKLRFGIVATRSKLLVQKNTFQNIISPLAMPLRAGIFVYGSSSIGLSALDAKIGGTIPQANNFNNCAYGVFNQYAGDLTIRNNNFNYNSTAILITKNNKNKSVIIDRNKINETRVGVLCYDNVRLNAQITENTLLNTSPVGAYNSNTGLSTSEVIYSTLAKYNVYNNSITGYYNGVYATNTFSTQITDNEIHLIPSSGVGQYQFGIRYENTNSIKILNNNVDKPLADNSSWWQYGIFGNTNVTPYVYCNGVNNMYSSLKFQGPNITTVNGILGNVMNNGHFGIWLDVSAEIGDQLIGFPGGFLFASDNQWNGFGVSNPQTYSSGLSNLALNAVMFTKNASGGSYYLNNFYANNVLPAQKLIGAYTFPSLSLSCNSGIVTPALMQNANNVATSTMSFVTNVSNLNAISKRQLLHNIKLQNINVSANPALTSFVNSTFTNSIGQFYKVDSIINNSIITGSMSLLSSATLLNSAITSTSSIESNKKMLHATYINMFTTEPDSITLVNLRTLAIKCPNDDGDAVFQARGILMYYDSKTYVSTCEEQATAPVLGLSQRLANATTTADENKTLSVYPNPTNKDITIEYVKGEDNEPAELIVYNQIGEIVLVKTLTDNKTEVNLSNISSGIYLYTIKQQGLILKTNKLVITK